MTLTPDEAELIVGALNTLVAVRNRCRAPMADIEPIEDLLARIGTDGVNLVRQSVDQIRERMR